MNAARGRRFAIATPHAAATDAGARAFDDGGNAVDAALAAAAVLAVVYPHQCGVGGDLIALIREPDGRTVVLNASGAAPAAVDVEAFDEMPAYGPHTVTVPGAVSGWQQLAEHWCDLPLRRALDPAIAFARDGVPVARSLARALERNAPRIADDVGLRAVFGPAGPPLVEGATLVQPALARTLERLADAGHGELYGGATGTAIARHLATLGSAMSPDDLAAHRAELDSALTSRYRDVDVSVAPPNSQGFVLLQILAAIERLGLDPDPEGHDAGPLAEVARLTAADRDRHCADPHAVRVPVGTLLDEGHLAAMSDTLRSPVRRTGPRADGDTVAVVAADSEGHAISLIQSHYSAFGSGILEPETGVLLHNRGACFVLERGHPNVLAGGKRPMHTLMPVLVHRRGGLVAVPGTRGGGGQPQIHAQVLARALDVGLGAADAVAAPRWLVGEMDVGRDDRSVLAEASVDPGAVDRLRSAGYDVKAGDVLDERVGHAHLVLVTPDGFDAGSDPRSDGAAAAR